MKKFTLSIIIPAYSEAENIKVLYEHIVSVLNNIEAMYEIIFVDDGSTDNTWTEITKLHKINNSIKGIKFSKNFGHQNAIFAGITKSKGDAVITMDADLQHPPEIIPELVNNWLQGYKIVNTIRIYDLELNAFKRLSSDLFYKIFSFLCGVELKKGMADFRLLDRQVVNELLNLNESGLFLRGLVEWLGYESTEIQYFSHQRYSGDSKYTVFKMFKLAFTGITSFSLVPLRLGILLGIITSSLAFFELIFVIYSKYYAQYVVPGWASAMGIVSFLFGVLFILIGLLGEYIGRIYIEVRKRPRYIIDDTSGI